MAINEHQATLAQEGSFELVEHSDALGDQCQEATTALTNMERKVRELEQRLEEEIEKRRTPKAPQSNTLVLMWIDDDEINGKNKGDSAGGGEQAPGLIAAETHAKAYEDFQAFKLKISQRKDEKAVLHEVASFSQLQTTCLEPFDAGGADVLRGLDGKLQCQESFYLSLGVQHARPEDKTAEKASLDCLSSSIRVWKHLLPICEHIVVWHLNNDDHAVVMEYLRYSLSKNDRFVLLGRSYLTKLVKNLVKKEDRRAGGLAATSKPSTAKPVSSSTRTEQFPAGARAATLGSNQGCSSGAKPVAATSNFEDLKAARIHEEDIEPHSKGLHSVDHVADTLTEWEEALLLVFVVCALVGWAYGGYVAACYMKKRIFGLIQ